MKFKTATMVFVGKETIFIGRNNSSHNLYLLHGKHNERKYYFLSASIIGIAFGGLRELIRAGLIQTLN